jgi:hypothetical protein
MTNAQSNTLVFKNQAGDYFLVPEATMEQGRVPAEKKAEVDQLMVDADTSGHLLMIFYFAGVATGALVAHALD